MILYAYLKGETLYFVFNHPGAKQEFHNTLDSIKDALIMRAKACDNFNFNDVKAYSTFTPPQKKEFKATPLVKYYERARGNFKNTQKDPLLQEEFEKIRHLIQNSKEEKDI